MKKSNKYKLLRNSKLILLIATAILCLGYLSYFIINSPQFSKHTPFTQVLMYPIEKRNCESRGGHYGYNPSLNGNMCYIEGMPIPFKPVIYLYPEKKININVKVKYTPGFSVTYPYYENGWDIIAEPSGKIINSRDGKEYSYLYWEGNPDPEASYDLSTGFIVRGDQTRYFLEEKLSYLGLIPREYNEFIVYWLPRMEKNTYNLIHFSTKTEYQERAVMDIQPQPDSVLRVFMVFKPLQNSVSIAPQHLDSFQRKGFTVVEWGGTEL